ncbi:MAG: histidine kinase N-terminal 7TM domain-containing protein, partial [Anaerovoracaceae bacterium]
LYPDLTRFLWYLYYLPMVFIPVLTVFVAMSLGRPENYRLPGQAALLYIPPAFLFLMVMTNDLHQKVFRFPAGSGIRTDGDYDYAAGYYLIVGWMLFCILSAILVMFFKYRLPGGRRRIMLPCIPILVLLVYLVVYNTRVEWLRFVFGDMTAVICLMYVATLEICIRCRFIRSNNHYRQLFDASTAGAQITDEAYKVILKSDKAKALDREILRQAADKPVMLEEGIRLCSAPVQGGYIFWQENISRLQAVLKELSSTREKLRGYAALLDEENRQKQRRRELEEQRRLYEAMEEATSPAMVRLAELVESLSHVRDIESAKKLHGRIAVVGAYIKRRSNMVFLADNTGTLPARELMLCLNESLANLRLLGCTCALQFDIDQTIKIETAGKMYDFFQAAVEIAWDNLPGINVIASKKDTEAETWNTAVGKAYGITLMLQCEKDMSSIADDERFDASEIYTEQDEDVCFLGLTVREGGTVC